MIKRFALSLVFTFLALFLASCDNSEVETLTEERDALQVQVEELNTRIADTESERDLLLGERDTLQREFDTLTAEFERTTGELEETQATLRTTQLELERAERELVARGVERDAILSGLQNDLERQIISLRGEIEQTMSTLGDIEQERDRLRNWLGEDVFPDLDPEPRLGGETSPTDLEETTVTIDTTEAVDELLEQAEEIEEELEEEIEEELETPDETTGTP